MLQNWREEASEDLTLRKGSYKQFSGSFYVVAKFVPILIGVGGRKLFRLMTYQFCGPPTTSQ